MDEPRDLPGRDLTVELPDGRRPPVLELGDPGGRPVLLHHGTPSGRFQAHLGHRAAAEAGVRLLAYNRPGYGAAPARAPSLASVGRDTVAVADALGIDAFAVLGISGGGPYAVATGLAAPERISHVAVLAGIGPWRSLDSDDAEPEERAHLALADAGDVEGALDGFRASAAELDALLALDDAAMVDGFFHGAPADDLFWLDAAARRVWAVDMRDALASSDGYAIDNVAWGGAWDVDPRELRGPVTLWYGEKDLVCPVSHGQWYAAAIPQARLVVRTGAGHGTTCFGYLGDVFAALG